MFRLDNKIFWNLYILNDWVKRHETVPQRP